ncbi:aminotransferase-like domain-containing protein [Azospirillum rugosum]|uniref:DNA-binding transcriptional MocR family regulator n=1 Tax=Azospirillum rugosum TaxID=416170 RepID=A0ABS4SHP6_9PROT|nr:PLP-dependent aminotransferase family protein [Azospirillum rugosum]MBP2292110.1 DNA-binding transcriptional MocR family regulator [Azospirillum rugosum]MDQ0525754.1 DNA-binding transcriptional MocR family regulator [Azospirillum rugosum]
MTVDWGHVFAGRVAGMGASEIRELLKLLERPEIISFAGGIPDPDFFPTAAIARAYEKIFQSNAGAGGALQYTISEGYTPLREWICAYMGRHGIQAGLDEVLVTSGSQQALEFVGKLLIGPGEAVAVTRPTYLGALQAFSPYEPRYLSVPGDAEGPDLVALEAALEQKPKFFYMVPDFQNPNGTTITLARREAILDLCAKHGVPVVEDAAYTELRYDGERVPPLAALDAARNGGKLTNVIFCGSFSKTMVPAFRVGWINGPAEVINRLVLMKQAGDLHTSTINQIVLHDVVSQIFDTHLRHLRTKYKERRDAMLSALEQFAPEGVRWTKPEGGMFVWIELPEGTDGVALLARAIQEANVAFVPGSAFHADRSGKNTLRLSFSNNNPERIREGIRRLCGLLETVAA